MFSGGTKASDLPIVMKYGRVDCDGKPRAKAEDFPNPRMGLEGVLSWCSRVFRFTKNECVAVIGESVIRTKIELMLSSIKGFDSDF